MAISRQAPTVLLDACVLYSAPLRDLLIELAAAGLFQARWTERIHAEWTASVLRNRPDLPAERVARTLGLMKRALPDAEIAGYEALVTGLALPDPDDRHVLAAAIAGECREIITLNLTDFPKAILQPHGITARHPDAFLLEISGYNLRGVISGMRACQTRLALPRLSPDDYFAGLQRSGLQGLAELAGRFWEVP